MSYYIMGGAIQEMSTSHLVTHTLYWSLSIRPYQFDHVSGALPTQFFQLLNENDNLPLTCHPRRLGSV